MGKTGKASIIFENPPVICEWASVVGEKEAQGPLKEGFDVVVEDPFAGKNTWEEAESELQNLTMLKLFEKSKMKATDIRYVFSGDLLGQLIASTFGIKEHNIPFLGMYGACSTMGEAMIMGSMCVAAGYADRVISMASSHFASAEKEFRFPLDYGNQRPLSATWTVTGAGGVIIGKENSGCAITGVTPGKIVDYGVTDSMNMGAAMAPAASDTIFTNFTDLDVDENYYDAIFTGDLGYVGKKILVELLRDRGFDISKNHHDCGIEIYDCENQDTHAGGSGCGCSATVLCSYIIPQMLKGRWKRILFVPTGAMMSNISFNEGSTVPGIAHAVMIEYIDENKG